MADDPRYPARIVIAESALSDIWRSVCRHYRRSGVEWGGLLWGTVHRARTNEVVPVVHRATEGVCAATHTSCELLPQSWELGRTQLPPDRGWTNIGDYHSHPDFGVFMSPADKLSFWSWAHYPYWVGCVIDPIRRSIGFFAKTSEREYARIEAWRAPDDRLTSRLVGPGPQSIGDDRHE